MTSLKRQIRTGMLAAVAGASAVLLYFGNAGVESLLQNYIASRLQHDADSVSAALYLDAEGRWTVDSTHLGPVFTRVYSGHYFRVLGPDTDIRSRSMWDYAADIDPMPSGTATEGQRIGPQRQRLLTWTQGIRKEDTELTVWLAEDISPLDAARRRYGFMAAGALAVVIALLVITQQWILRRGFSRMNEVQSAIRDLQAGRVDALSTDVPDEIEPLVREINRLLVRLEGKVSRSRNAMGNLAHEMKRPMHLLQRLAGRIDPDTAGELLDAIEDLDRLVSRELKRARIVGVATPGRQTTLDDDVPVLVKALDLVYPGRAVDVKHPPGLVLPHDRDDMLELLGNLLDNALKHGEGRVALTISEDDRGWTIEVEDDGPGVPEASIRAVLERGARLDESRSGYGLGLAICTDIVREYGGRLELENRAPRGLLTRVRLPRQDISPV